MENFVKKFQRSIAGIGLIALLASFVSFASVASASTFSDVDSDHYAFDAIDALSDMGVMTGYADGTFGAEDSITREQVAKILVEAFVGGVDSSAVRTCTGEVSSWAEGYMATANMYGILEGAGSELLCNSSLSPNRAEMAKMTVEAAGLTGTTLGSDIFPDVSTSDWFDAYVGVAYEKSVVNGYSNGNYGPADYVLRGQSALMTYNAMYPVSRVDEEEPTGEDATVQVSLSDDSPEADTIPSNATSVAMASFDFTAEGDDAVIDSLVVHQYGISNVSTSTVYLYEGSERLTSGTSVNSSTHEATFNHLDVAVDEGDTVTLTVRMDVQDMGTSTGEVGFELESADAVDANEAAVEGDFPVTADKFSLSTTDAGTVTVLKNGTIDDAQVGEDDAIVSKFQLSLSSTEGGLVKEVGLYLAGTISTADVENLRLYVSGDDEEALATAETTDDLDVVRFDLGDGYAMEKGATKSFYVLGDFNTGRTGDTVTFYVDQDTDVVVEGDLYGYGLSVNRRGYDGGTDSSAETAGTCTGASSDCAYQTLEGGDITITSSGPAATDIAVNGKDVTLMDFTVTSVADVTFDNFPVALTASEDTSDDTEGLLNGTTSNFTDIKVVDSDTGDLVEFSSSVDASSFTTAAIGGTVIDDTSTDTDDTISYYLWTDNWEVSAGAEYNLALKVDVANTSTLNNMTLVGSLPLDTTYPTMKDVNNKTLTNSSVLVPTSTIAGRTMTIKSPSLTLSLASTPSGANTYVKGSQDVSFVGLVFACGKASDCEVTDVTLQGYLDDNSTPSTWKTVAAGDDNDTALSTYVGSVSLVDIDENVIATAGITSTFTAVFDNISDWTIDAGDTEIIYVKGDISTNAFANSETESIGFGISSATNVTAYDEDGNSFSPTGTPNATSPSVYVVTAQGGTLTFSVNSSTPKQDILVAGTTDVEISKFTVTGTREAFLIDSLSVNNRQSDYTNAALKDYDDNIVNLYLEYEDEDGVTQTTDPTPLVDGTAQFSGLTMWVPKDDSADVTVYADMNTVTDGADVGTYVELTLAFNNLNATSQGSSDTYNASKLDATSALLSIGTITWTQVGGGVNGYELSAALDRSTVAAGGSTTLTVDTVGVDTYDVPVGTLLCVDDNNGGTCSAEDIYVVTASTDSGDYDTLTVMKVDDAGSGAGTYDDGDDVLISIPAQGGYLTATNRMFVYETKPTLALASGSPSGTRTPSATDNAFAFTVTADSREKIQINTSVDFATCVAGTGATVTSATQTTATVDGSSCELTAVDTNTDSVLYANTADLSTYGYVSFWFRWHDDSASGALPMAALSVAVADANDGTEDHTTAVAATNVPGSPTVFDEDTWYFVKDVAMPTGTTSADVFIGLQFTDVTNILDDAADDVFLDQVRVYNQKIEIDLTSDGDFDRTYNQGSSCATAGSSGCPVVAYLQDNGSTVATGYVDTVAVDLTSDGAEDATNGTSATVTFVPTTTEGLIEIAKGATKTYTVVLSTLDLLHEDTGENDPLTFSINAGSVSETTVTAGDFWWHDTNATVRWIGKVANTTLNSNTVTY
ncbi:MAG: S-layer homology domain-containing protein [Candidatus Gracilibacteria bacterium]|jgi:hypothetical protein